LTGEDPNHVGTFTASCTGALDKAGNAGATASVTYQVTSAPPPPSTFVFNPFSVNQININQRFKTLFLLSTFTLGQGSDGINPVTVPVKLVIANFTTTIPAGSFRKGQLGVYAFAGKINNVSIQALITPLGNNRFVFQAAAYGTDFTGTTNPVKVVLMIGNNDSGETSVNRDREKPHGSPLPHHRAYGSRTRRFGRLSQTWKSALADSQFQPERALSSNQPRFHPSHQARARWTRRMPYRGSRTSHCSSLSIPSRGTVRAFGLRRCGSAYRLLRLSAWSASLALPAFLLLCPLLTSPRYSAPVTRRPASIR
jgi:hypothetical protein